MKIKTSELTGAALDWAALTLKNGEDAAWYINRRGQLMEEHGDVSSVFTPSTDWSQGGPIIEREKISVYWNKPRQQWVAMHGGHLRFYRGHTTPLIAAMRCFVASRLGDDIDIPEELA